MMIPANMQRNRLAVDLGAAIVMENFLKTYVRDGDGVKTAHASMDLCG